jgi:type 1 glutamine amidotransferase
MKWTLVLLAACLSFLCAPPATAGPRVLVFTKTLEYRHASIPQGIVALATLGAQRGWQVDATEDAEQFTDATLSKYDVVVWLSTTGGVLNADQQAAYERFQKSGKGTVGIHAGGTDTHHHDWPWFRSLIGAEFKSHPRQQQATLQLLDAHHPAGAGLPATWSHWDEWYNFTALPAGVSVVLAVDEASYDPGPDAMVKKFGSHPIAWYQSFDGGRAFYTALGHTVEDYSDPLFLGHLAGAIEWAAGATPRAPQPAH